jgi:hypothetical protein
VRRFALSECNGSGHLDQSHRKLVHRAHFGRAGRAAVAVEDGESHKWLATVLSSEETSTQVEVCFTRALQAERLDHVIADRLDAHPTAPTASTRRCTALARAARTDALVSGDEDLTSLELDDLDLLTPEDLTERQAAKLAWIAKTSPRLHRAYLLKEGLRFVFQVKGEAGKQALDRWLSWAQRCRIPAFVALGRKIRRHREAIDATLEHQLSQGLIESTNTKLRVLHRMAFGFPRTRCTHRPGHAPSAATSLHCRAAAPPADPRKRQENPKGSSVVPGGRVTRL